MKKRSLMLSLVCTLCVSMVIPANAETTDQVVVESENISFETSDLLADIGKVSVKQSIMINGEQNHLYPTFDDSEAALENFKAADADLLNAIKTTYDLDEFSDGNWCDYRNYFYEYLNAPSRLAEYTEGSTEVILFNVFMDYY